MKLSKAGSITSINKMTKTEMIMLSWHGDMMAADVMAWHAAGCILIFLTHFRHSGRYKPGISEQKYAIAWMTIKCWPIKRVAGVRETQNKEV